MSHPLAAGQPRTTLAAKPNVIVAAPVRYAETNAGPLPTLGTPPPAPFYPMGPPSAFPPVMPPGTFPGPRAYLHPPPPPPPPPGVPGPYPGTPFLPAVDPRYITQYPVCPGPPGIPRSLRFPPPGDFSYQGPALIHGIVDPVTMARPAVPPVAPPDIQHFKVYIGKIAPTVDNDFVLSLLQVCGVVTSWEPVTNPLDGTHTRFGFCEFESAEGCLRARRLLNKLSVDGQELALNIDEATRHVPFKYTDADKDAMQRIRSMIEERMKNKLPRSPTPAVQVSACTVDDNGDVDAQTSALEERKIRKKEEDLGGRKVVGSQGKKDREVTAAGKSSLQIEAVSSMHVPMERESTVDHKRKSQHRKRDRFRKSNGEEKGRERKAVVSEGQKDREVSAAGKSSLQIDAVSSMHVCIERECTVEHETKRQHGKREFHMNSDEDRMKSKFPCLSTPPAQPSANIVDEKCDNDTSSSSLEEGEISSQSETEEQSRESRAVGLQGRKDGEVSTAGKSSLQIDAVSSVHVSMGRESTVEYERKNQHRKRDVVCKSNGEEKGIVFVPGLVSDKQSTSAREKVCFKLQATSNSGDKKTLHASFPKMIEERMKSKLSGSPSPAVQVSACIVDEDGDDDTGRSSLEERKIRRRCEKEEPLGKRKAVGSKGWKDREVTATGMSSLQVDAAPSMHVPTECESTVEHRMSSLQVYAAPSMHVPRECESTVEYERKSRHRERDGFPKRNVEEKRTVFVPSVFSDKQKISAGEKVVLELQAATSKSGDKKPLDAKQLLATVPKMKGELFAHDVNWAIYDKYGLHERVRPWISKKATEVFGEELAEFVDYVVATTKEHVTAPRMLELLESLLDDDAEKFVLLMWRKLIFEIKKVEEGY